MRLRIDGAIIREQKEWDRVAFVACAIQNSLAKFVDGPRTIQKLLGRAPWPWRNPTSREWVQHVADLAVDPDAMPDAEQSRLIDEAGFPTGYLSQEETDLAYAELDLEHWRA